MASFYVDHDVSVDVGELLRERGHAVTLTRDLQLERAHDGLQLLTATRRQALLVSHNGKDFRGWELYE